MPRKGRRSQAQKERWRKPDASELPDMPADAPPCSPSVLNKKVGSTLPAGPFWMAGEARADFRPQCGTGRRHKVLEWPTSPITGRVHKLVIPPEVPRKKFVLVVGASHLRGLVDGFVGMPESQLSFGFMSTPGASACEIHKEVLHAVVPRRPDAVCVMSPSNNLTSSTVDVAGVDFAKLLATCLNRWSKVFVLGFIPRLVVDPEHQELLRQEYRRVCTRMGVKYFPVAKHFPLSDLVLWSRDGVHLSDREGMGILSQLLWSSASDQLLTSSATPEGFPKPPVQNAPELVVKESSPAPPSPVPRKRTAGQGGKTSPPRKRPQRIATQQEEESFFPVNPVWFSGQALSAMEKVSPSHESCPADVKPTGKPLPKTKRTPKASPAVPRRRPREVTPPRSPSPVNKESGMPPVPRYWRSEEDAPLDFTPSAQAVAAPAVVTRPRTPDVPPDCCPTALNDLFEAPPAILSCKSVKTEASGCSTSSSDKLFDSSPPKIAKTTTLSSDRQTMTITDADCNNPSPDKQFDPPQPKIAKTVTLSPGGQATTIADVDCNDPSPDKKTQTTSPAHTECPWLTAASTSSDAPTEADNTRSRSHRVESVQASHSQSDERYNVFSRNHQCTCNALTFLAYQTEGCQFTGTSLDRVLARGDALYVGVKQQLIHDKKFRNHHLTVEEMPKQVLTDRHLYSVVMSDVRCGYLKTTPSSPGRRQWSLPLATQLESLSKDVSLALILIAPECIAVFRDQSGRYGVFDSHSRDPSGFPSYQGKAIMMTFAALGDLADHLLALFRDRGDSASYEFVPLSFHREGQTEHPQESSVNDDHDLSETEVPVFQSDSGTALSDETAENPVSSSAVPQPSVKLSKVSKDRRRKARRRAHQQPTTKDKALSQGLRQMKKIHERKRYATCANFRQKKMDARKEKYAKDSHREHELSSNQQYYAKFQRRIKQQFANRYRTDPAFQRRLKMTLVHKYQTDAAFQSKQKKYIRHRYETNPAFRSRQKHYLVNRYKTDPSFQSRQKNYLVNRYKTDPSFQSRQKHYLVNRYKTDPAFQSRQKKHHAEKYKANPEFRLHHIKRCILLRRHKLSASLHFQQALSIKRKYRHLRPPCQPVLNSLMAAAIAEATAAFRESISHGPTYVCTVCHRTMFPNQVVHSEESTTTPFPEIHSFWNISTTYQYKSRNWTSTLCRQVSRDAAVSADGLYRSGRKQTVTRNIAICEKQKRDIFHSGWLRDAKFPVGPQDGANNKNVT
ncbi:uncharacterized protein V6R79_005308 [Siganus canaliculatus]